MAEEPQYAKRKFDDSSEAPPPRRATGFSSGPASDLLAAAAAAAAVTAIPVDEIELAKQRAQEIASRIFITAEAKRPRVENGAAGAEESKGFGSAVSEYSLKPQAQSSPAQVGMGHLSSSIPAYGFQSLSKKIQIPNGRVGVIIGKGGETIRNLQLQSGAKIQVTRDMDHNPNSQTRPVEIVGTPEQISKAEQMVNEVLAEAETGSSGSNVRKFSITTGGETFIMKVPNNKVGLVIGKGGETIKSMQAKSGARIQLIPLHPPPGDTSTERTVHIDGSTEQIELAKQLINEVISENRVRIPQMTGGYSQQGYRPPRPPTSWAPPGAPQVQQPGYGYMQPGAYTGQPPPYNMPQQPYAGYPPPAPPASGWDQSSNPAAQPTTPVPGYDYYNQQPQNQQPIAASSTPADTTTYNYNQQPAANYNPQGAYGDSNYPQSTVGQQAYGQDAYSGGYNAPTNQQGYPQTGYDQQGYAAYGAATNPTQDGSAPTYGAPGVPPAQQGYGTAQAAYGPPSNPTQDGSAPTYSAPGVPTQVPPAQQAPQSAQPSTTQQGYAAPQPSSTTASYPPQGSAHAGYAPPTTVQPGYGSQPPAQPGYGQPAPSTQPSYAQPAPALAGYPQNQPGVPAQSGYGQDATQYRPAGFAPGVPQQGYGQQQPHGSVAPQSLPGYSQPYGDSYGSGGYSQPPASYSNDNSVPASQPLPSGAAKVSPHS